MFSSSQVTAAHSIYNPNAIIHDAINGSRLHPVNDIIVFRSVGNSFYPTTWLTNSSDLEVSGFKDRNTSIQLNEHYNLRNGRAVSLILHIDSTVPDKQKSRRGLCGKVRGGVCDHQISFHLTYIEKVVLNRHRLVQV